MKGVVGLVVSLVVCFSASAIGGLVTARSVTSWYQGLDKPSWNPPSWVFGPVWTLLYAAMAVAWWLAASSAGPRIGLVNGLFLSQLFLNVLWSVLFFGMRRPDLAFAEILLLWVAILLTALAFRSANAIAFWLMIPYLAWVAFASVLNGTIWNLNR